MTLSLCPSPTIHRVAVLGYPRLSIPISASPISRSRTPLHRRPAAPLPAWSPCLSGHPRVVLFLFPVPLNPSSLPLPAPSRPSVPLWFPATVAFSRAAPLAFFRAAPRCRHEIRHCRRSTDSYIGFSPQRCLLTPLLPVKLPVLASVAKLQRVPLQEIPRAISA